MANKKQVPEDTPKQLTLYDIPTRVYQSDNGDIEAILENGDMWLSQKAMSVLFGVTIPTINEHIKGVIRDDKLDDSVIRKIRYTASDNKSYNVNQYNLDVVLPVGYRVHSSAASRFRRWANDVLREYITKGIVINPDSPKARHIKKQLELMDKAQWNNEQGIRKLNLQLELIESLKVINTLASQVVINPNYGQLMNTEYLSLFGMTASGIKAIVKGNVRDAIGNEAMATLLFAETMIAGLLARSKTMTMPEAIRLYQEAMKPIRQMHQSLCEQFGIDHITGKPLLTANN